MRRLLSTSLFAVMLGCSLTRTVSLLADEVLQAIGPRFVAHDLAGSSQSVRFLKSDRSQFVRLAGSARLAEFIRLNRPSQLQDRLPSRPLSQCEFRNGDRLTVAVNAIQGDALHLDQHQGQPATCPLSLVTAIRPVPGLITLVADSGLEGSGSSWLDSRGQPLKAITSDRERSLVLETEARLTWPQPLLNGQATIWLKRPTQEQGLVTLNFEFATPAQPVSITLTPAANQATRIVATSQERDFETQPITGSGPEFCIRVIISSERLMIAVDQHSLAHSANWSGALTAAQLTRATPRGPYHFGPTFVQEVTQLVKAFDVTDRSLDAVLKSSGDVLHGTLHDMSLGLIRLKSRQAELTISGRDASAIFLDDTSRASRLPAVHGWHCRLVLQGQRVGPQRVAFDEVTGAITAVREDGLDFTQALGLPLKFDWDTIRQIEPLFGGESRLLATGPRHLGNATRTDFARPRPDGISWKIAVPDPISAGDLFLSCFVADLNPAGSQTLRGSPTLSAVRSGDLATKVFVNGREAGVLNAQISQINSREQPVRVSMPLTRSLFRADRNEIEFRQTRSQTNDTLYDDCELRNVALEVRGR